MGGSGCNCVGVWASVGVIVWECVGDVGGSVWVWVWVCVWL